MYEYVNQLEDYVVPTSVEAESLTHGDKSTAVFDGILTANEQHLQTQKLKNSLFRHDAELVYEV